MNELEITNLFCLFENMVINDEINDVLIDMAECGVDEITNFYPFLENILFIRLQVGIGKVRQTIYKNLIKQTQNYLKGFNSNLQR